jgi:hypothetical protein
MSMLGIAIAGLIATAGPLFSDGISAPRVVLGQEVPEPPPPAAQEPEAEGEPLLDFGRLELAPRLTLMVPSEDFEADPIFGGGLSVRVPSPWLSRGLLGLESDDFGAFVEIDAARIERDTEPELEDPNGALFFVTLGLDYTILRDDTFLLMGQAGLQYGHFGGVTDLDNGISVLLGGVGGIQLTEGLWVTASPQIALADAGDFIFFAHLGVQISF